MKLRRMLPGKRKREAKGQVFAIDMSDDNDHPRCQATDFLSKRPPADKKTILNAMRQFETAGELKNEKVLRPLEPRDRGIWEFKCKGVTRLACFYERPDLIIVTHGFPKSNNRDTARQRDHAISIRDQWHKRR